MGIQRSTSINSIIRSLPRNRTRHVWNIIIDNKVVGWVAAKYDSDAERYVRNNYPNKSFRLEWIRWEFC